MISYSFWQRQYAGALDILHKTVLLNGHTFPIMGVTPANFFGVDVGHNFEVALPLCAEPLMAGSADSRSSRRDTWWLAVIGRLKPGWNLARANAQLKTISTTVFENTLPEHYKPDQAGYYRHYQLMSEPGGAGQSALRGVMQRPLLLLLGIAGLVLLIACANLANLTLARASAREREMAVRLAIGAGRNRLIRQLLSESLLLTFCGTSLGVLLAAFLCRYMVAFISTERDPIFVSLALDWRILAFTTAVAVLTCVLFGLTPALRATQTSPAGAMKASGRGLTADRQRFTLRRGLVVGQVAMSLVLLACALLFVRSLRNLMTLDAGLQQNGMLVMGVRIGRLQYTPERSAALYTDLLDNVRTTQGVESAAVTSIVPISGASSNNAVSIVEANKPTEMLSWFNRVSDGYFQTIGTPLLAGRDFNRYDTTSSQPVAIVSQEFARKFLGGANPLGKHVRVSVGPGEPELVYQIVGLARDSKYQDLREEPKAILFTLSSQQKIPDTGANFLVRSNLAGGTLISELQKAVAKTNPEVSIEFQSFEDQVQESLLRDRLMATLSAFFGFLAATLATVGLYGVISYMVARRRSEIGIRIALGATSGGVLRLILKEAGLLVAVGLVVGTALAVASSGAAGSLLYGLKGSDPSTIATAVLLLAAVAMLASFVPARRASRTEPMTALREE